MTDRDEELAVLTRGLDQAAELLSQVTAGDLDAATPCSDWTGAELVDHLASMPGRFATMMRGQEVDWAATPQSHEDPASMFRTDSDELLGVLRSGETAMGPDWVSAEVAVHTYDLAVTMGRSTSALDVEVAERGLAFMQANLAPEMRAEAFGPELPAPAGADAYQRIAAFAGRAVTVLG